MRRGRVHKDGTVSVWWEEVADEGRGQRSPGTGLEPGVSVHRSFEHLSICQTVQRHRCWCSGHTAPYPVPRGHPGAFSEQRRRGPPRRCDWTPSWYREELRKDRATWAGRGSERVALSKDLGDDGVGL